ncbi:MAG: response regulator transcription factor [Myxococcota bacterium]
MRLLLVDDHPVVRRGLCALLKEAFPGGEVGEAGSAAEVWERLAAHSWDVVLLDISLGVESGLEVLMELRRRAPGLPVLMVSAHAEEDFAVRSLRAGAAGYLVKTSAPDEVVAAVAKVLQGRRYVTASLAERLAATVGGDLSVEPHEVLSQRELQVLCLVARGLSLKQIAAELDLSEKTIATYRSRVGAKLGLSTNVELTRYALTHKLVD